ncbi:MAG: hypothetical protein ACXVBH_12365 [Flavisolibacter sp.]
MRKLLLVAGFAFLSSCAFTQTDVNNINIAVGKSMHGTGDLNGIAVSLAYEHELAKRFSFGNALTTTINYGKDDWATNVHAFHYTTAGIQLNPYGQFHIIANRDQKLSFGLGGLLRFQSTSLPTGGYGYYDEPNLFPEPFYAFRYYGKTNTLCPGYTMSLTFRNRIASKYFLGVTAGFQNDTHGDAITSISLLFERVLPKFRTGD